MAVQPRYINFDLHLTWSGNAKKRQGTITLTHKKSGAKHEAAYDSRNCKYIRKLIQRPNAKEEEPWHREAGRILAEIFFPEHTSLGKEFRKALKEGPRVRLRLFYPPPQDPDHPDEIEALLDVPWEYLYIEEDPGYKLSGYLCTLPGFSLVHCLKPPPGGSIKPRFKGVPLKVAFLSVEPKHADFTEAFEGVNRVLRDEVVIRLTEYQDAGESHLTNAFRNFDIVQILCHGSEEAIFLKDDTLWEPELRDFLKDEELDVKAAVLCACESGLDPLGVAAALHRFGISIVIGMARSISVDTAQSFMKLFYSQLTSGVFNLEEALARSRNQLREYDPSDRKLRLNWGLPRLYLRSNSSNIILKRHLYRPYHKDLRQKFKDYILEKVNKAGPASTISEVQAQIREWTDSGQMGCLYLSGPSGSGKSTEIARLLKDNPRFVYHICFGTGAGKNASNPLIFSRDSLFPQLDEFYGSKFRAWVDSRVFPITVKESRRAFLDLVINPLRKAQNDNGELPIIVVDGLENAVKYHPGKHSILKLLTDYASWLFEGARLIVTADVDQDDEESLQVHKLIMAKLEPVEIPMQPINDAQA